jgi:hypothetical protein
MKNIFRSVRDIFKQPTPASATRPHGLTEAQFAALKRLSLEADYKTWQDVLDARITLMSEQFRTASDPFRLAQLQGMINGLLLAGSLVDEALLHDQHAENERRRREKPAPERSAAVLYGTPAGPAHFKR